MSTTGRDHTPATAPSDIADALDSAAFVRLVSDATGEAIAATGVVARALDASDTPFQASVSRPFGVPDRTTEADVTIAFGHSHAGAECAVSTTPAATAFDITRELDTAGDPILALAGTIAGQGLDERVLSVAERHGIERRPGIALPIADTVAGLSHSTLLSGPFSGTEEQVEAMLSQLDLSDGEALTDDDRRRLASLVSLAVTDEAPPSATDALGRGLHPYVGGPFETVGGYADVLTAVARADPGTGIVLAMGHDHVKETALSTWREHTMRVHDAIHEATTGRYDGLYVARGEDMPVRSVSRLVAEFHAPEPVTLAVTDGRAAAYATDGRDVAAVLSAAAEAVGGDSVGNGDRARATFDVTTAEFIEAVREVP
jgi:hypothetical protein